MRSILDKVEFSKSQIFFVSLFRFPYPRLFLDIVTRVLYHTHHTFRQAIKRPTNKMTPYAPIANDGDEVIKLLQQTIVNEDEYLRYRISERFNELMKKLFAAHKKDALPETEMDALKEIKEGLKTYQQEKENQTAARAKLALLAKQIGLNISELTDEEIAALMKALEKSQVLKKYRGRK